MSKKTKAPKPNKNPKHAGGRPGRITLPVIQRVTARLIMGMPAALALSLEDRPEINGMTWAAAISRYPQYAMPPEAFESSLIRKCLDRLEQSGDCRHLIWVLTDRFPEDFAAPAGGVEDNHRTG